jgi:hypothetical protein
MDNVNKTGNKANDEIDLLDLFSRIGRSIRQGFNALGRAFLYTLFFMLRKWLWLGLSVLIGIAGSYGLKYSTERLYSSDITLRSNTIPNSDMIVHINKLHTFTQEKNLTELATSLSVDPGKVRYIKDIKAYWVIDEGADGIPDYVDFRIKHNPRDTINVRMDDRFVVRVKTSIPQELSSIRDGILSFVKKNEFFQGRNELRQSQANSLLERIDYDLQQLDSLQKVKYFEESRRLLPSDGGQMVFLQEHKTQLLHEEIYELIRKRQELEVLQTIYPDLITLLSDFTPPAKAENGALFYGRVVIPVIFFLAIVILLLIEFRKKLSEISKKY